MGEYKMQGKISDNQVDLTKIPVVPTTFHLDPRVLDDYVGDGVPDVEIEAGMAAYIKWDGEDVNRCYAFYVDVSKFRVPESLLGLSPRQGSLHGELSLRYQKAEIIFMPVSDGERYQWGSQIQEKRKDFIEACMVLYVRGEFLKGDAEALKRCGVTIKP